MSPTISSLLFSFSVALPLFSQSASATYTLNTNMTGATFFNNFNFWTTSTTPDPTHGFVTYLSQSAATSAGMLYQGANNRARFSADATTKLSPTGPGRSSVRITSKSSWTHGLFIHDMVAMPEQACGVWPAVWMLGPNWPTNGEIDIVEGVNYQTTDLMSLHTSPNCTFTKQTPTSGTLTSGQCDGTLNSNQGCGFSASTTNTYGLPFNNGGGGVYATQWTSSFIKIWMFPRNAIPADITAGKPVPGTAAWGTPQAYFLGGSNCNIDTHFATLSLVMNIDFCGDWAGNVWSTDSTCKSKATDCATYVANNPTAFTGSHFLINYISVYQDPTAKKRSDVPTSAYEDGVVEARNAEATVSLEERGLGVDGSPKIPNSPEDLQKEAAIDAYMRGNQTPLLSLMEEKSKNEKRDSMNLELPERIGHSMRYSHAHSHMHRHVKRG